MRARGVRPPAPERAGVRLLHELLGVLARSGKMSRHPIYLVGVRESLLLEAHTVARLGRDPGRIFGHHSHGNGTNARGTRVIPATAGISGA